VKGFFSLSTPRDLFGKLETDHKRIVADPVDTYAAFDFCVTAWHLVDWKFPDTRDPNRLAFLQRNPLLRVCEHLAVGGKHLEPDPARHTSVASADDTSVWARGFWAPKSWAPGVWSGALIIRLDGDAKVAIGDSLLIKDFADRVLALWRSEL
jgi:hypothetical protein